jgi:hypothetical protein
MPSGRREEEFLAMLYVHAKALYVQGLLLGAYPITLDCQCLNVASGTTMSLHLVRVGYSVYDARSGSAL